MPFLGGAQQWRKILQNPIVEEIPLISVSLGTKRFIKCIRFGKRGNGKKAYIQAGLHADETPGFLVMHHLIQQLESINTESGILGEIILVPVANPIGLSQWRDEILQGRFDFFNNINFNRNYIDIATRISDRIKDELCNIPEKNIALIRKTAGEAIQSIEPEDEVAQLKQQLFSLSYDADIVLDLHCEHEAMLHIYMGETLWDNAEDLSAHMGAQITLLADDSGVTPFDEACAKYWWQLAEKFPDYPIPPACLAATIELRGVCDVSNEAAAQDAANIIRFLQHRGLISGSAETPPEQTGIATPLSGVDYVKAPASGVVVFRKTPGDWVAEGEVIAEIISPFHMAPQARINAVHSETQGLMFARICDRIARPGRIIAKIAGKIPLEGKGDDLLTL